MKDFNDENHLVIVSEYIENDSLERNNKSPGNLNDTKKLINIFGIASSMRYLHSKCIIHRDLKPSNVLEDRNFYPKICDLGSSRFINSESFSNSSQMTPLYTAPEIFSETKLYGFPCDVYSFGMVTYFIMTGSHPNIKNKSWITFMKEITQGYRPNINSKIPESYSNLINDCWQNEPSKRPTFGQIVSIIKSDPSFITDKVDKDEFYEYVKYIEMKEKEDVSNIDSNIDNNSFIEEIVDEIVEPDLFVINATKIDIKNFTKQDKLGSGLCGDVYKVLNNSNKQFYAAKVMKDKFYADDKNTKKRINLIREVRILSQLMHPSIMKFYGYSSTDFINLCRPVIITELAKNGTLEDIIDLERNGMKLDFWTDTMKLINIYGIAASMKYLHSKNILHRDLKPGNILVDQFLFPKLADFGFSKSLITDQQNDQDNQNYSKVMGTKGFVAPEVLSCYNYSKSSDVYAFAMVVYEIMTTEFPFYDKNEFQVIYLVSIKNDHPELNNRIPRHYKSLIKKCWDKDLNKRPSFESIVNKLETDKKFITEKVDENLYFKYIRFIKGKKLDKLFETYLLESIYKEHKENQLFLFNQGFLNIDEYEKQSKIDQSEFSKFYSISYKLSGLLYLAETSRFDANYLTSKEKEDFSHEVKILSDLKHPTIQQFIGYSMFNFKHHPKPVIVKEYLKNRTLFDVIENERK